MLAFESVAVFGFSSHLSFGDGDEGDFDGGSDGDEGRHDPPGVSEGDGSAAGEVLGGDWAPFSPGTCDGDGDGVWFGDIDGEHGAGESFGDLRGW